MYTKTKFSGLALTFALLLGVLTIASPQNVNADTEQETTAQVEFESGNLSLVQVATFDFGEQDIAANIQHHDAIAVGDAIQVSDLRGSGEGWRLEVSLSAFVHTESGKELEGAYLTLSGTDVAAVNDSKGTAPISTSTTSLQIDSDESKVPIFTAAEDAGMGVWGITTELADAKLTVLPGTAYAGDYEADLAWTLVEAP